jgi:lipoprotein-anchoring transpeptidase ErfK/SrfK
MSSRPAPFLALLFLGACTVPPPPEVRAVPTTTVTPLTPPPDPPPPQVAAEVPHASSSAAVPEPPPARPRLTSVAPTSWIYGRPKVDSHYIGYVRAGTSVTLRAPELVPGEACKRGFYQVEPRGFVCNDHTVTLAPGERFLALASATAASPGPLPYRYAFSDKAPMYTRVPTPEEQQRLEGRIGPPVRAKPGHRSSYEDLASTDAFEPVQPAPPFLEAIPGEERQSPLRETIPAGSMLSFTKVVAANGRTFLLSTDLALVPADRVRLFRKTTFRGTPLGGEVELPVAWIRRRERPQYRRLASGSFERTGASWPAKSYVRLTGAVVEQDRRRYHETRDRDAVGATVYLLHEDGSIVERAERAPIGVKSDQKWIVVHLGDATLVAYEGLRPVYTTLVSPGRGGIPVAGQDPVEASTTPLGVFYVTFKDKAKVMTHDKPGEPRTHWIADVPFAQYFDPPFALHAAYWHDRFGEDTSAGCINVSPIDAEHLFAWSDPPVPAEWQGATGAGAPENGPTTAIVVRR